MLARALKKPWLKILLSVALSWGVLFNTVLVTMHNLGARENIGYINGGKVFRLTGTMWYHIPGLQEIGLAPQNIGGQINLRNNEFAMLERDLRSVESIKVDFGLQANAMLLVILDRHREGTFWAVRLTAFEHEGTPFVNALIRYENGRVAKRIPLTELGEQVGAGDHEVSVDLSNRQELVVTVDGRTQRVAFDSEQLRPGLALGCGELNTTIYRWAVDGQGEDGERVAFRESFSVADTFNRSDAPLALLALFAWLLLLGGPLLKVLVETRANPLELLPRALLFPTPRWIFGLVCMVPWMPLTLQWVLGGLYVFYVWMTLWEALAEGRHVWKIRAADASGPRWGWIAVFGVCAALAAGLFAYRASVRQSIVGETAPAAGNSLLAADRPARVLKLGERVAIDISQRNPGPVQVDVDVNLAEGQVLRLDLMRSLPTEADVYQVDRSQDRPEDAPAGEEEEQGPGDFELQAVSGLVSTTQKLPGMLRWLSSDKLQLSPQAGWTVSPGPHRVTLSVDPPVATLAVDGVIQDFRTDLPHTFSPGGVQLLPQADRVEQVSNVTVRALSPEELGDIAADNTLADVLGVVAMVLLLLALFALLAGAGTRIAFGRASILSTLGRGLRATASLQAWLLFWLSERFGWTDLAGERLEITIAAVAIAIGTFNLTQMVRQSGGTRTWGRRGLATVLLLLTAWSSFEGVSLLYPERRHNWTHTWNDQLSPQYFWMHDPMIRRLNPWFIDHRFKRRDWDTGHPETVRVVVFGGSQTYGWGIPSMDRMAFSDQLERALHAKGYRDVEVLNAAFPGVKTGTGLRWFAGNLLRYEPDIVVINFVVNEFMNVDQYHVWSGDRAQDSELSPFAVRGLLEQWRGFVMGNHLSQIIVADVYEVYAMEQYLRWWHEIAERHGIKLVFSIEPTNLYVESGGNVIMRGETNLGAAQSVYRKLGDELDVPVYDALPHFVKEQENMWFYDTMHMSRLGHRVFAENLAETIIDKHLVPANAATAEPDSPQPTAE